MTMTWRDLETQFQQKLAHLYEKDEIKQLYLMTIESIGQISSNRYMLIKENLVATEMLQNIDDILQELITGRPIQQILREAYFYGNLFEVSSDTLIPRPETEELVHLIIKDHNGAKNLNIIDIGTGTGCIPISLAKNLPGNTFTAVDISAAALEVARRNNQKLETDIQFMNVDILEWELVFDKEIEFDIIVSNPPYITPKEKEQMHQNVLAFEPHLALFIEEEAPLLFYDYISDFAKQHLSSNGTLYFEINQYLARETAELLRKKGFKDVEIRKDINGADRMIRAKYV